MLSDNLGALRDRLLPYRASGVQLSAKAVDAIVAILDAATGDAEAMEAAPVPLPRRACAEEGVVDFVAARHARRAGQAEGPGGVR